MPRRGEGDFFRSDSHNYHERWQSHRNGKESNVARVLLNQETLRLALKRALSESTVVESSAESKEGAGILFVCNATGRVLLALRSRWVDEPEVWGIPGGGVEPGESPLEGALREASEEIGWDGEARIHHAHTLRGPNGFRYHNFVGMVDQEFEPTINWESEAAGWFHPNELPSPLHHGVMQLMQSINRSSNRSRDA
jgi:8-oxo-dGTP pyrophosphatase MutT (NUDIX family)